MTPNPYLSPLRILIAVTFLVCLQPVASAQQEQVSSQQHFLQGGTQVPVGQFEAVGTFSGNGICTATLIDQDLVLTAAHCACSGQSTPTGCVTRGTFTFRSVFPVDNPATSADESRTRQNVSIRGDVAVHPLYTVGGWLRNDYALLRLDQAAHELVLDVEPIAVERPTSLPQKEDLLTLVGFGRTGDSCTMAGGGIKRQVVLPVSEVTPHTIVFRSTDSYSCPGDSGGPALNTAGHLVGVASSGDFSTNSAYDPAALAHAWIFSTERVRRIVGRVTLLRIHDVGTGYGPPTDPIDGEVVVKLDTARDKSFGFTLRKGADGRVHASYVTVLRGAFAHDEPVLIEYQNTGLHNRRILRVVRR